MKNIKNRNFDLKVIIGSLVMVVALFAMAFLCFPKNDNKINDDIEIVKASTGFKNIVDVTSSTTSFSNSYI